MSVCVSVSVCERVCVCVCARACVPAGVCMCVCGDLTGFSTQTTGSPEPTTAMYVELQHSTTPTERRMSAGLLLRQAVPSLDTVSQTIAGLRLAEHSASRIAAVQSHHRPAPPPPYRPVPALPPLPVPRMLQRSARPPLCLPLLAILPDSAVVHRRDQPTLCPRRCRAFWTPRHNRLL